MSGIVYWIVPIILFDLVFRAIAMWHAARNSQRYWFIVLAVINSVGLLPIIYLLFFKNKRQEKIRKNAKE